MSLKEDFQKALLKIDELYPTPAVMAKSIQIMKDPNLEVSNLVALLRTDSSLTAEIIKVSNSAYYGFATECTNLASAINRVGFYEVIRILNKSISKSILSRDLDCYGITSEEYWGKSAATAILMEKVAELIGEDPNDAYTIGILHAIGRVLINQLINEFGFGVFWDNVMPIEEWEIETVGFNYTYAGSVLLKRWNFPNNTCGTILNQNSAETTKKTSPMLAALQFSTELIAQTGDDFSKRELNIPEDSPFLTPFNFNVDTVKSLVENSHHAFVELKHEMGISTEK